MECRLHAQWNRVLTDRRPMFAGSAAAHGGSRRDHYDPSKADKGPFLSALLKALPFGDRWVCLDTENLNTTRLIFSQCAGTQEVIIANYNSPTLAQIRENMRLSMPAEWASRIDVRPQKSTDVLRDIRTSCVMRPLAGFIGDYCCGFPGNAFFRPLHDIRLLFSKAYGSMLRPGGLLELSFFCARSGGKVSDADLVDEDHDSVGDLVGDSVGDLVGDSVGDSVGSESCTSDHSSIGGGVARDWRSEPWDTRHIERVRGSDGEEAYMRWFLKNARISIQETTGFAQRFVPHIAARGLCALLPIMDAHNPNAILAVPNPKKNTFSFFFNFMGPLVPRVRFPALPSSSVAQASSSLAPAVLALPAHPRVNILWSVSDAPEEFIGIHDEETDLHHAQNGTVDVHGPDDDQQQDEEHGEPQSKDERDTCYTVVSAAEADAVAALLGAPVVAIDHISEDPTTLQQLERDTTCITVGSEDEGGAARRGMDA